MSGTGHQPCKSYSSGVSYISLTPLALQMRNAKVLSSFAFTEAPIIKPNKSTVELTAKLASFNYFSSTTCIGSPGSMLPDLPRTLDSLNLRVLRP
jgi:hypothetical protein